MLTQRIIKRSIHPILKLVIDNSIPAGAGKQPDAGDAAGCEDDIETVAVLSNN